jgi:hypothetical protein
VGNVSAGEQRRRITTFEQRNLLSRLGIEISEPWVWISSDGPIGTGEAAPRLHVDGPEGFPTTCPFPYSSYSAKKWDGFAVFLVGLPRLAWWWDYAFGATGYQFRWQEDGRAFDVELYYQRIQHRDSKLYAEVTSGRPDSDAGVHNALLVHKKAERTLAWKGLDLLLRGPTQGRPARPTPGSATEHWLSRVAAHGGVEVGDPGEKAARAEYMLATPRGPDRFTWWNHSILRTLRRRKQRQKHSI